VGDAMLRRDRTACGESHKYARVVKVRKGTDRMICMADVEYRG
jgi:hypothetical protein